MPSDYNLYELAAQEELRIELAPEQRVVVKLIEGKCESFGTNLALQTDYTLKVPGGFSFFTWSGCKLEVNGMAQVQYVTKDTSFPIYANINYELEKDRQQSKQNKTEGPNILLLGREATGKTAIARTLSHYALRFGWYPTYIDINPQFNNISLPGTIAATPIEQQSKPKHLEAFGQTAPIVYFYGHPSIQSNYDYYLQLCTNLRKTVQSRLLSTYQRNVITPGIPIPPDSQFDVRNKMNEEFIAKTKYAGTIIDAPAEILSLPNKVDVITDICRIFQINVIFVIDNEALHAQLLQNHKLTQDLGVALSRIPRSLGVVLLNPDERHAIQQAVITKYFYGPSKNNFTGLNLSDMQGHYLKSLQPTPIYMPFDKYNIYSTNQQQYAPITTLPLGQQEEYKRNMANNLQPVQPTDLKQNSIMAISYHASHQLPGMNNTSNTLHQSTITTQPVLGFVQCASVDIHPSKSYARLKLLYPNGFFPEFNNLLVGSIAWANPHM